jgi:hypothetical protein
MSFDPVFVLSCNAAAQVLVSSLLGSFMLIPLQPWGRKLAARVHMKSLLATHLDWYMLAFMQWGAAFIMSRWPSTAAPWLALLLIFGGWTNALPYLLRGFGINAFAMAGDALQRVSATIAGASVLAILTAWTTILVRLLAVR